MEIVKTREGDKLTLALSGRLDTLTAPQLEAVIKNELDGAKDLVLDLKDLIYVSSAGLRVFLMGHKTMSKIGSMTLCNVCDDIKEVLTITGFAVN